MAELSLDGLVRQIPYNLEAEQSVLGAVLVEPGCLSSLMEMLRPESFFRPQHTEIFTIMSRMFTAGEPVDFVTVLDKVRDEQVFESEQDARQYFMQLVQIMPSVSNIEAYAKIVQDKHNVRRLMEAAREILEETGNGADDAQLLLDSAEQKIFDIRQGRNMRGFVHVGDAVLQTYDRLQKLSGSERDQYLGISTGFSDLDNIITGLNRSDLIIIAGRPSMGKTTIAMNIADHVAFKQNRKAVVFSLEMSCEQLVARILSGEASISSKAFRSGIMTQDEWDRLAESAQIVSRAPLFFDDSSGITVAEMKAKLRRVKDLDLVVIDYLQLMSSGRRSDNRVNEVSEITRSLKIMARELNVPVIVCSQLSRGPEARTNKRPMLSDLRESGSIEQDADIVMMLYRESYYDKTTEEQNVAECIVVKNRHGETDTVKLVWDGFHSRFSNMDQYHG